MTARNIWIPDMTVRKLEKLIAKVKLTSNDKETLLDFKYFLLFMKQDAVEKGFYTIYSGVNMYGGNGVAVLKNKYWISNIDELTNGFSSDFYIEREVA